MAMEELCQWEERSALLPRCAFVQCSDARLHVPPLHELVNTRQLRPNASAPCGPYSTTPHPSSPHTRTCCEGGRLARGGHAHDVLVDDADGSRHPSAACLGLLLLHLDLAALCNRQAVRGWAAWGCRWEGEQEGPCCRAGAAAVQPSDGYEGKHAQALAHSRGRKCECHTHNPERAPAGVSSAYFFRYCCSAVFTGGGARSCSRFFSSARSNDMPEGAQVSMFCVRASVRAWVRACA